MDKPDYKYPRHTVPEYSHAFPLHGLKTPPMPPFLLFYSGEAKKSENSCIIAVMKGVSAIQSR